MNNVDKKIIHGKVVQSKEGEYLGYLNSCVAYRAWVNDIHEAIIWKTELNDIKNVYFGDLNSDGAKLITVEKLIEMVKNK